MPLTERELDEIFDSVMRDPRSRRGLDVEETCRLLAEALKAKATPAEYPSSIRSMEQRYLDAFINTAVVRPGFVDRIKKSMNLYL
jgi:hypothetical protein